MQTEGNTYAGFGDAAMGIYRKDGVKDGLFAGVSAGEFLETIMPVSVVYMNE